MSDRVGITNFHGDDTKNLIDEVRRYPCLYAKTSQEYRDRFERDKAWELISQDLGLEMTACKKKWRGLRDRYVREIHKMNKPGFEPQNQTVWEYWQDMCFLHDFVAFRKPVNGIVKDAQPIETADEQPNLQAASALIPQAIVYANDEPIEDPPSNYSNIIANLANYTVVSGNDVAVAPPRENMDISPENDGTIATIASGIQGENPDINLQHAFLSLVDGMRRMQAHALFLNLVYHKLNGLPDAEQEETKCFILNYLNAKLNQDD